MSNPDSTATVTHPNDGGLPVQLETAGNSFDLMELTPFGFKVFGAIKKSASNQPLTGQLIGPDQSLEVQFRVRRRKGDMSHCTFHDLTLAQQKQLDVLLEQWRHPAGRGDRLNQLTYDQLAGDQSQNGARPSGVPSSGPHQGARKTTKSLAVVLLFLGLAALAVILVTFVRLQYSLDVSNAVMVGNYLPLSSPMEGEVTQVLVAEGTPVHHGEVLAQLYNPQFESEIELLEAELENAQAQVAALDRNVKSQRATIALAAQRIGYELKSTQADLKRAEFSLEMAGNQVKRLARLIKKQSASRTDYERALNNQSALKAECTGTQARIDALQLTKTAAESNLVIVGDRIQDELGRMQAQRDIAQARVLQLTRALKVAWRREKQSQIVAPQDGTVFAVYRQEGEYLTAAQEVLALQISDAAWAMGHVPADWAMKIRPGQRATIQAPSLGVRTTGRVAAVGHRAVYGRGGYTAEFRGDPTHVPIKVTLDTLPDHVPSGMRLNIAVKLDFGIPWLDRLLRSTASQPKFAQTPRSSGVVSQESTTRGHRRLTEIVDTRN